MPFEPINRQAPNDKSYSTKRLQSPRKGFDHHKNHDCIKSSKSTFTFSNSKMGHAVKAMQSKPLESKYPKH